MPPDPAVSEDTGAMPAPGAVCLLVHQRSHRVTPRISLHTFSLSPGSSLVIRPSQHITLQFPPDLDPILGSRGLSDEDRCVVFTPCRITLTQSGTVESLDFLSGNGRVTGLLGLPRPQGLEAQLVEVGGGFPEALLDKGQGLTCVAGGTGVSGFLALASSPLWQHHQKLDELLWSIRGDDFPLVEYFLNSGYLKAEVWAAVKVFVTAGEETTGLLAGKPLGWWTSHLEHIQQKFADGLALYTRRITKQDLEVSRKSDGSVLFCGGKALQWQIKMWSLGNGTVYCTDR